MHEEVEITNSACGEAHTAVTCLAHEMQQRLNPSAIIKFTATPVNAGLKLHQSPEQQCTIWQILVGVKVRHFSGCRFVHRPARRSAPTEQRSCAGLWSNRGAVFAL
jgi:hypothetical protein